MRTAIDTNILSAILSNEPQAPECIRVLRGASREGALLISAVVWVELCAHPAASERVLTEFVRDAGITVDFHLRQEAWLEAGRRFAQHASRRRGSSHGEPKRLLADFVVGAHALVQADQLYTRDATRYRQDFPDLRLL